MPRFMGGGGGGGAVDSALAGDVTGTLSAAVVAKIKGKTVPTPGASEDGKGWVYDHASGAMVWTPAPQPIWTPADQGLKGATFDPMLVGSGGTGTGVLNTGYMLGSVAKVTVSGLVANLMTYVTVGGTLSLAEVGLYTRTGATLIAKSGSLTAVLDSTGVKTIPLVAEAGQSLTLAAGEYWVVFSTVASVQAQLGILTPRALEILNVNQTNLGSRAFATANGGAALPAALTSPPGFIGSTLFWAGLK